MAKRSSPLPLDSIWLSMLLIAAVTFLASLVGVASRPVGLLAVVWPANALLAGMMARRPELSRWPCWMAAFIGFFTSDLLIGDDVAGNLWLTLGNLVSTGGAYLVLRRLPAGMRRVQHPTAMLYILGAGLLGGLASATMTCWGVASVLDRGVWETWGLLFGGEFANHMMILPLVLTFRPFWRRGMNLIEDVQRPSVRRVFLPIMTLSVALLVIADGVATGVGGPGAMTFVLPALLVPAMTLGVFPTALLALISNCWTLIAVGEGWAGYVVGPFTQQTTLSLQIGLALLTFGPVAVASAMQERNDTIQQVWRGSTRDGLTGAVNRAEFFSQGRRLLGRLTRESRPLAVIMCDLDRFKAINDTYGHAAGDAVLQRFGQVAHECIRDSDIFGRIGGEEFALLLPGISEFSALQVAERIRVQFADTVHPELGGASATVSIGLHHVTNNRAAVADMLAVADRALYAAKQNGRNRVQVGTPDPAARMDT